MKFAAFLALLLSLHIALDGQVIDVKPFDKIMVSHRINLHLEKGDQESVRFEFVNIDPNDLRYEVSNRRLQIYLDGAKLNEPSERFDGYRKSIYSGGQVHAYVTYRDLEKLVVRGEEKITCISPIESEKFTLRLYGESDVDLAALHAGYFRAAMYGENELDIGDGQVETQRFSLYGENAIRAREVNCHDTRTTSFGENDLVINSDNLSVTAFGETEISYAGRMHINRKIILGESAIRSLD